jgi:dTDP-glucose pyrophosphorylase
MSRRVNLIPMAGAGRRFSEAGYSLPKPLIPVDGVPMIVRAASALPPADEWIFVCQQEHLRVAPLEATLQRHFSPCRVVSVMGMTAGQACTCLLAREFLRFDDKLVIGACDNSMLYDGARHDALLQDYDGLVWTFRRNPVVLQNPRMYGWVETTGDLVVRRVSVKVPLSAQPMNDHAVIGAFSFRRAGDFVRCAEAMIAAERRVNSEFYADEVVNVAVETGLRMAVFEVDAYVCWGTPRDLETYHYWRKIFNSPA